MGKSKNNDRFSKKTNPKPNGFKKLLKNSGIFQLFQLPKKKKKN